MGEPSLPEDTDPDVFERLVDGWRQMSVAERAALADQASIDVVRAAEAGIRARWPDASDGEILHHLMTRRYGAQLADELAHALADR